jgi:hypothetical protein
MYIASQTVLIQESSKVKFVKKYVNFLMLFFPIISFLLIPTIPGTTIITLFAGILCFMIFLMPLGAQKEKFINELIAFFCVIIVLSICSQVINLLVTLKLPSDIILINPKDFTKTFFRISHITQSMSLVVGFTIYLYIKYFADWKTINYIFWGIRLLCFYGIYEFLFYMIFHQNGDFFLNRQICVKFSYPFKKNWICGISILMMKSYNREPSMFVFTSFPFWVLAVGLKRRFDSLLILGCLLLTFSTTAYFCILLFTAFWMVYKRQFNLIFYMLIGVAAFCFILQLDAFKHLFDSIYKMVFASKISGNTSSSIQRSAHFFIHINYWANLNFFNQLVGIGFGYVRSTDFLSTVLVNNGVVGFILFTTFFYNKLLFKIKPDQLLYTYKIALVLLYFILMTTVPEFAYPCLWIFLGLGYVLSAETKKAALKAYVFRDGQQSILTNTQRLGQLN